MRRLIVYSSVTGNTRAVAEAIHSVMPDGTVLADIKEKPSPNAYDFIILGFWAHRAGPDPRMRRYMAAVRGKTVALFGTLAAYPDSDHGRAVAANAEALLAENRVLGTFLCQGRLPEKRMAELMSGQRVNARHPMTEERRSRLLEAAKHPNEHDFFAAKEAFAQFLAQAQSHA